MVPQPSRAGSRPSVGTEGLTRFRSRPLDMPEIWQDYLPNPFSWANSLLVHALVLTAMVLPFALKPLIKPFTAYTFSTTRCWCLGFTPPGGRFTHGGGGSGDQSPLPASHGSIPMFSRVQFTPALVDLPQSPLLPMPASVVGPPELKLPGYEAE